MKKEKGDEKERMRRGSGEDKEIIRKRQSFTC
jgi:hypothetical protein